MHPKLPPRLIPQILAVGKKIHFSVFTAYLERDNVGRVGLKILVIVPKNRGGAVLRNRIKRRLKSTLADVFGKTSKKGNMLVVANARALKIRQDKLFCFCEQLNSLI